MLKLSKVFLLMMILSFLSSSLRADITSVNPRPRNLAMGGAGLGAKGDKDSAMLNPAGLADVETGKLDILPLLIEVPFDVGLVSSFKDYNDVREKSTSTQTEKQAAFEKFLNDVTSEATAVRLNFYPSFTTKHLHFGLLVDAYGDPRVRVGGLAANQMVELGGTSATIGLILGGGYSFLEDSLQVGMTIKPLYRMAGTLQQEQTLHDILLGLNSKNSTGGEANIADEIFGKDALDNRAYAVGVDLGVKYKIPYLQEILNPSVGLTYQDIGDTRFIGDQTLPADIPQSISMGLAVHPDWGIFKNTFALDLRNINREEDFMNKIHLGAESVIWNLLAIRAGISQGYFTGGVGVMLKIVDFDIFVARREAGHHAHIQDISTLGAKFSLGW